MGIKIEGADKLTYKLQRIQEKAKDMSPAMKKILYTDIKIIQILKIKDGNRIKLRRNI